MADSIGSCLRGDLYLLPFDLSHPDMVSLALETLPATVHS